MRKKRKIADNETDVVEGSEDRTTEKENRASNKIITGQYLGMYINHMNIHQHTRYTDEARNIL